jgi:exopolysaccharide biosynthesis polyprenyl glycosylphosphotransferase
VNQIHTKKNRFSVIFGGEILLLFLSFGAGYYLRFVSFESFFERLPPAVFLLIVIVYPATFYVLGLYLRPIKPWSSELYWRLGFAVGVGAVGLGFLKYAIFLEPIGRGLLFIASFLFFLLSFVWRSVAFRLFGRVAEQRRIVFIGTDGEKEALREAVRSAGEEIAFLGPGENGGWVSAGADDAGAQDVAQIVVGGEAPIDKDLWRRLLRAQRRGTEVIDFNEMYQNVAGRIPVDFIREEDWFWRTVGFQLSERETFLRIKRAADFGLALVLVGITLPFWLFIAVLIKITSKGKVFYRQNRVGKNGTTFRLVKFRSMVEKAEEGEPVWAEKDDKRITAVGGLLRKIHLDELPQLWNVLRGEMSLVGPRPERPEFVEMLEREIPYYGLRHLVKPGLTGWAQINHPYAASLADSKVKLEYDLYYIAHMSLGFDLRILLRTVQAPVVKRG